MTATHLVVGSQHNIDDDLLPRFPRRLNIRLHGPSQRIPRSIIIVTTGGTAQGALIQTLRFRFGLWIVRGDGGPARHLVRVKVARSRTRQVAVALHRRW